MKGSGYNTNNPKAGTHKGGGGTKMATRKPNGDQYMPMGKVDKYEGFKGDGGAKNGKIKGC